MSSSIPPSTPGKPWQPPAPEDLAPELPQYEILGLLGRGGMGAVYLARQKSLKREVAIKVLPPSIEDNDMSYGERFKTEAQVMARLNHPGIIAVYDAGETPSGLLYFVMEYVQGTDVHQMIASSGRLPPQHAHAIAAHVCEALAYAHANGLVHRDIKPANIMVDTQGRVKVADFGLAKMAQDDHGFTKSNMAVGTPDFVAPEALVAGMPVDQRADLYAMGVMIYQMLTGQIPRGAWMPASVLCPGLDRRFDDIIIKAMQYDRDARHSSAAEMRAHLDSLLMPAVPAPALQHYSSAGMAKQNVVQASGLPPRAAGTAAPHSPAPQPRTLASAPTAKSKTPLLIGLAAAAAIGIGAFVMFSRKADVSSASQAGSPPAAVTDSKPALPFKVVETPKPASVKTPEPPKVEPKPVAALTPPPSAPAPEAKAVSPMPGGPGISAPALQSAAASSGVPISNSRSQISNDAPAAFPPGQWVEVFSKFDDLPADLRQPNSGVKFEEGWIDLAASAKWVRFPSVLTRNYAVKARFRRKSASLNQIIVRRQLADGTGMYMLRFSKGVMTCFMRDSEKNIETKVFDVPVQDGIKDGGEYVLEFGVVGDRLVGRYGDSVVGSAKNGLCLEGVAHIQGSEAIRDIEVINLDGIPEADALRILGVDALGNDLRALAVQQKAASMGLPLSTITPNAPAKPDAPLSELDKQLATLETQFQGAAEREAGAAFVQSVGTLNQGYLRALVGALKTAQASGHLDQALVVQEETKRITANQPMPTEDEVTAPDALKKLRATYRTAHAKLIAERTQKLAPLYDRYDATLATLQTDLTKSGKLEDATKVKAKREEIAQRKGGVEVAASGSTGAAAKPTENLTVAQTKTTKVKADPAKSRAAAEYALKSGAGVLIEEKGVKTTVEDVKDLPKGNFALPSLFYPTNKRLTVTDEDLVNTTQAAELESFELRELNTCKITSLVPFQNCLLLKRLMIAYYGALTPVDCQVLGNLPSLISLSLPGGEPIADMKLLLGSQRLQELVLHSRVKTVDEFTFIGACHDLTHLTINVPDPIVANEGIAHLGNLEKLEAFYCPQTPYTGLGMSKMSGKLGRTLTRLTFGKADADSSGAVEVAISKFPLLVEFHFRGEATAASVAQIKKLSALQKLTLHQATISPAHVLAISGCKALTELTFGNGVLTSTDIAELKRLRSLTYLRIYDNGIKIDASTVLPALPQLKSLTQLDLPESQFTTDQAEALRKLMPGCQIALIKRYD